MLNILGKNNANRDLKKKAFEYFDLDKYLTSGTIADNTFVYQTGTKIYDYTKTNIDTSNITTYNGTVRYNTEDNIWMYHQPKEKQVEIGGKLFPISRLKKLLGRK